MARITVQAVHVDGERRRWTLSERIAAENLDSEHYTAQLLEGVRWATADAEGLESPSADPDADPDDDARRTPLRTGCSGIARPDARARVLSPAAA